MQTMRLDKLIANATVFSRSQAHKIIKKGLVSVNGETVKSPAHHVTDDDEVRYEGLIVNRPHFRYLMLNKPPGVVCANRDDLHATVFDQLFISRREELRIAGRLDIDTTGLVLLSDDGQWIHRVTSPRHAHNKVYLVDTRNQVTDKQIALLQSGVQLKGEHKKTRPARVEQLTDTHIRLAISEGKYHQVKRMMSAVGNEVSALHRESIGPIQLDPALDPGEWRELSEDEFPRI